ncbi:MAG: hypothetical protein OXR64_05270 [Chloroflexota bacterium]|nr:hypothetical protein [Chloroflexota bacterium]
MRKWFIGWAVFLVAIMEPATAGAFAQPERGGLWCHDSPDRLQVVTGDDLDEAVAKLQKSQTEAGSGFVVCIEYREEPERRGLITWSRRLVAELGYATTHSGPEGEAPKRAGILFVYREIKSPVGDWVVDEWFAERQVFTPGKTARADVDHFLKEFFKTDTEDENVTVWWTK